MGGNWGTNTAEIRKLPLGYFEYLRDLNVNWVGISVALHVNGSMDSTVKCKYSGPGVLTFTDEALVSALRAFRQHGFNVYLTLSFEMNDDAAIAEHPVA